MGLHSKRQAILLGLEDRSIDAWDLLQVLERREVAVLRPVRDDRRGLRAPQRQATLQLDRRRRVHIDSRQLLRRKAGREILEHGPELLVRSPGAERAHLPQRGRPPGAILPDRHHDVRGMTLRAQLDGLLAARPFGQLRGSVPGAQDGRDDHRSIAHVSAPSRIRRSTAYHRRSPRIPGCRRPRGRPARWSESWCRCSTALGPWLRPVRRRQLARGAAGRATRRKPRRLRPPPRAAPARRATPDRKSTRLNSSHSQISYAVFCLKKKKKKNTT